MTATAGTDPKTAATLAAAARSSSKDDHSEGMSYLESLPRKTVTVYLPLFIIMIVLLFPFYWMFITSIKPDQDLLDLHGGNPLWVGEPTFRHFTKLLFESNYPRWLWNTMYVAFAATFLSLIASVFAAYAIVRLRFRGAEVAGALIFLAYLVPPSILFIPLSTVIVAYGLFDSPLALILTYPTILIPFCTWLLMGYFKTIPFELEECALIDGASRWQILTKIILPLAGPGLAAVTIFAFIRSWNEFLFALVFLQSRTMFTMPIGLASFQEEYTFRWDLIMAGAGIITLPILFFFLLMQKFIVAGLLGGAVKG